MSNSIHAYALIKSLYDANKDYLDTFDYFLISSVSNSTFVTAIEIQERIKSDHKIQIPISIITTICHRLRQRDLIETDSSGSVRLKSEGEDYLKKFDNSREINRKINSLIISAHSYFLQRSLDVSQEEVYKAFERYVAKNQNFIIDFLNPSKEDLLVTDSENQGKIDYYITEFINYIDKNDSVNFSTFRQFVFGSLIFSTIYANNAIDDNYLHNEFLTGTLLYLDTNFIFGLFGFDSPSNNQSAKEVHQIIKDNGIEIRIFDFTVIELTRYLNGYAETFSKYDTKTLIHGIYPHLRRLGYTPASIREYIRDIEYHLIELNIKIESTEDETLKKFKSDQSYTEERREIQNYKPDQNDFGRDHDLAAIYQIQKKREKIIRRVEESKYFFLSCDARLFKFNLKFYSHSENSSISEICLDKTLAFLLWLRNPNLEMAVSNVIIANSKDLLIDKNVWDKFYYELNRMKQASKIQDAEISNLFYDNYIQAMLSDIKPGGEDIVNSTFILENIRLISEKRTQTHQSELEKLEREKEEIKESRLKDESSIKALYENENRRLRSSLEESFDEFSKRTLIDSKVQQKKAISDAFEEKKQRDTSEFNLESIKIKNASRAATNIYLICLRIDIAVIICVIAFNVFSGETNFSTIADYFGVLGGLGLLGINFEAIWKKIDSFIYSIVFDARKSSLERYYSVFKTS